jgi:hypothetical protein
MDGSRARDKRDYGPHSPGWPRAAHKRAGVSVAFDARLLRRREKREARAAARVEAEEDYLYPEQRDGTP